MGKYRYFWRKIIFTLLFLTIFSALFSASYKINDLKILAQIRKDGSVKVTEQVVYKAEKINGIIYNIDAEGYGEPKDISIFYEKDGEYIQAVRKRGTNRGYYSLSEKEGLYKIKLYYPLYNEKETFIISYILPEGISVYKDTAQFNRKMVGRNWQNNIKNIEVTIELPEETLKEKIYAFGHGPLTGNIEIVNGRKIKYSLKNYYPGEFIETNILFPKEIISEINKKYIKNYKAFDDIMALEKNLAEEANRERERAVRMTIFSWTAFGAVICWIFFVGSFVYIKNGKRYKVQAPYGEYFRELPDDYTPAVAGAVSARLTIKPEHLFATVMDLVRKDFFQMSEEDIINSNGKKEHRTILRKIEEKDTSSLKEYEKYVFQWYINEMGNGTEVVMEDIESYISGKKNAKAFYSKYKEWCRKVEKDLEEKGLTREKNKKIPVLLGVVTGFLMFPGGVFLTGVFRDSKFMLFTFIAVPFIVFIISRKKLSKIAEEAYAKWSAFKKFLIDYSNLEEAKTASIYIWEHYFVYAVALGVAEKVAKGYKKIESLRGENRGTEVGRYYRPSIMNAYIYSSAFHSIEKATSGAANRSIREVSKSNHSSAGGRGGGFSGGSSGGGGGRGGGGAF